VGSVPVLSCLTVPPVVVAEPGMVMPIGALQVLLED